MTSPLRYSILFADLLWITTVWLLAHPLHYGLPTNAARIAESRYFYLMATGTILDEKCGTGWIFSPVSAA
jgi:hypothetical protein